MALEVKNLKKKFDKVVIDQLTYTFEKGKLYVIKGVSGSGKTTLLNILGGLDERYDGEVSFDREQGRECLASMSGYIFQQSLLLSDLTIRNNLLLVCHDEARIDLMMKRLGIEHLYDRYPSELSGGERQRVAIVRALSTGARVLLADEPTASLDEENAIQIARILSELRDEGCMVIVATHEHYFDESADEILYLNYGKLQQTKFSQADKEEKSETAFEEVKTENGRKGKQVRKRKKIRKMKRKERKKDNLALFNTILARGKRQWKISSFLPIMILVLLILLISTVSEHVDTFLQGYLGRYYPSDLIRVSDGIISRMDEEIKDTLTVYYPYMAKEDGVQAFYYADKENSVLAVDNMLMYGKFPETENEIIVSYEFAAERFGEIDSQDDIIGKKYIFLENEFVISGCMYPFEENQKINRYFSHESMFDADQTYTTNRGSMIFINYDVIRKIGEISETKYGMYMAVCEGIMRDRTILDKVHEAGSGLYYVNWIDQMGRNASLGMGWFVLILYIVLVICFMIACVFIRSKVDIELFYRRRELGFLQVFRIGRRKLKRMLVWEYLIQLVIALTVPFGVYFGLAIVFSILFRSWIIFNSLHMVAVFGVLLLLYVQTLQVTIRRYLKRDVITLIRG